MRALSGKEFARIIERHGWSLLRVHGSHHIYGKPGGKIRLSIPIHGNRSLGVGMLRDMLKTIGLEEKDID